MPHAKFSALYERALAELTENILPWWMRHAVDEQNGGFLGAVGNDNAPIPDAPKHIVLNARLVWTFASAYRVLGDAQYLPYARRAFDFFMARFRDPKHGGAFTQLHADGSVQDAHKFTYGNAFSIYGMAEYHRATGDGAALAYARDTAALLTQFVRDPVYGGWFEACQRDWTHDPWQKGVNRLPTDEKTMNTHLHLIEAYTCLLRSEESARSRVREMLHIMLNRVVNRETHHFHYFQDRQWNPTTPEVSFGHDIEGSWLMMETAEVLAEPEAHHATRDICVSMARACLDEGLLPGGALLTEYDPRTRHAYERISWWEQNETVVGFLNAWQLTGEEKFLDASLRCFDFIDAHFVDHEKGGWFASLSQDGKTVHSQRKCDGYICPYHNARMCLEIIERYRSCAHS